MPSFIFSISRIAYIINQQGIVDPGKNLTFFIYLVYESLFSAAESRRWLIACKCDVVTKEQHSRDQIAICIV